MRSIELCRSNPSFRGKIHIALEEFNQLEPLLNEPLKAEYLHRLLHCAQCLTTCLLRPAHPISSLTSDGAAPRIISALPGQFVHRNDIEVCGMAPMGRRSDMMIIFRLCDLIWICPSMLLIVIPVTRSSSRSAECTKPADAAC